MPKCSICFSKHREKIDIALASGGSERSVAKQFGVSASAIHRHKADGHICEAIKAASDAESNEKLVKVGNAVKKRIDEIYKTAFDLVEMAKGKQDPKAAAYCLAQAIAVTSLLHESAGMEKLQEEIDSLKDLMKEQ